MTRSECESKAEAPEKEEEPKYTIDMAALTAGGRSPNILLTSRLCEKCRGKKSQKSLLAAKSKDLIKNIARCCSRRPEYLRPGTPLKEAIFRVILSKGNTPTGLIELQQILSEVGIIPPYSTESSTRLIQIIADSSDLYGIGRSPKEG